MLQNETIYANIEETVNDMEKETKVHHERDDKVRAFLCNAMKREHSSTSINIMKPGSNNIYHSQHILLDI